MKAHLIFALKVFVAILIINGIFGLLGSAGAGLRSFWNNPLGGIGGLFGGSGPTSTTP